MRCDDAQSQGSRRFRQGHAARRSRGRRARTRKQGASGLLDSALTASSTNSVASSFGGSGLISERSPSRRSRPPENPCSLSSG
jgi:hypothetical protein